MSSIYGVVLLIAAMAVLCALLECLMPQGNLKKIVLFSIGLIFLITITAPVVGLLKQSSPDVQFQDNSEIGQDIGTVRSHEELLRGYYDDILLEQQGGQ